MPRDSEGMRALRLAAAIYLIAAMPARAGEAIIWATEGVYPPFVTGVVDGAPEGLDRDVAEAICAEIGRACGFVSAPWRSAS
jgi:ABC-type amino acid transport substrate-binding protein